MIYWKRLELEVSESKRARFYADVNCTKLSHVLCHEILRMRGKKRKEYFDSVHDLWDRHIHKELPYIYYNEQFRTVSKDTAYRFVTIDAKQIS
jgi:hypothetical protein